MSKEMFGRDKVVALSARLAERANEEPERATSRRAAVWALAPEIRKMRAKGWKWREISSVLAEEGLIVPPQSLRALIGQLGPKQVAAPREPAPARPVLPETQQKTGHDEEKRAPVTKSAGRGEKTPLPATDALAKTVANMQAGESSRQTTTLRGSFSVTEDREDL